MCKMPEGRRGVVAESLRAEQRRLARELILRAAADEIVESGLEDLSLQTVADRAGVSKRTLYNYFASREELLLGVGRYSNELLQADGGHTDPTEAPVAEMIVDNYRAWSAQGSVMAATLSIGAAAGGGPPLPGRVARRRIFEDVIRRHAPDLDDELVADLGHLVSALASSSLYRRLVIEDELEVDRAAALVSWALSLAFDAIESGELPARREAGEVGK